MIPVVETEARASGTAQFQRFPLGENTSVPASMLDPREMASCIDYKLNPGGQLETRPPVTKWSNTAIGAIKDIMGVTMGGTQHVVCSDADNKIYDMTGDPINPVQIDTNTVEGTPFFTAYNDVAVISDGSHLKYCEDVSEIKIAYNGDGTQYDNYAGDDDTTLTAARVAVKFTSETWPAGYTIPLTKIEAKVMESGGTAAITARLRAVSDDSILAEKEYTGTVPSSSAGFIDFVFIADDVTTEMSPGTEYYASLEGSNFVVQCTTVASGGRAYTYSSSWAADTAKDPIMKVYPGVPPKSEFARVSGSRLWLKDPDEPGMAKSGNYTHLDWSISIGVIDQDKNSFEIGAMEDFYGKLYVYGTQDTPYLSQLQGNTADNFALPLMFQRAWSTPQTLINANSDLWSGSGDGVDTLAGVQEYGDLRTFSASDPIAERLENWDSDTAIAGYNAKDGQYWLYMPGYDYVSVAHVKQGVRGPDGQIRYPWTRYELPFTPTCFRQVGDLFLIGADDGFIYQVDRSGYKDLGTTQIYPSYRTAYVEMPFDTVDLVKFQLLARSTHGANMDIKFYVNGNQDTPILTKNFSIPMSDALTINDLLNVSIEDIEDVAISPSGTPLYADININCYSFQIEVSQVHIAGAPVFFNGMIVKYEGLD